MQNDRKELLTYPADNDNNLSSQFSQVMLEAHEQRLLSKSPALPISFSV